MKKSELYRLAQYAVLQYNGLTDNKKVEVLRELIAQEDLALFVEKQKEEEREVVKLNEAV